MKKYYDVLIIDDHQIIIDIYKKALLFVKNEFSDIEFKIDDARDCASSLLKVKNALETNSIDLVFLDISLPTSSKDRMFSGEDIGVFIRKYFLYAKIIVCTNYNDNLRLNNIIKAINPDGLLIKGDIEFKDIVESIKTVLNNETFYSKTVVNFLRSKMASDIVLCNYDIQILLEISTGAKMKELVELIPLSKAAIEKRKRRLKLVFNIHDDSDKKLVLAAREKGFI
jgi:two-component system response regulator NreC